MTLEEELIDLWECDDPVEDWGVAMAEQEFRREGNLELLSLHETEEYWERVEKQEEIIKKRMGEALISNTPFLRTYAQLLSGGEDDS